MALKLKKSVAVEGLRELDAALGELPKATGRNVLKRVLIRAGEPIASRARELAPDDPATGAPDLHTSIAVSAKIKNKVGAPEYAAVLRGGGSKEEARAALRTARREAAGQGSFAEMHVGPDYRQFHGTLQEFGTSHSKAQPFMRPAWDEKQDEALGIIKRDLGSEIMKAANRVAARAAKKAMKG